MNVDFQYPSLSSIAKSQGLTLQRLAENACLQTDKLLRLCDCCQMARDDYPRWRVDHYHYLATIDECFKKLHGNNHAQMMMWQKLVSDKLFRKTPSIFLDTVAEAAWAIHFINGGSQIKLEVPFQNKNADIVLIIKGKEFWLDVVNVELKHIHRSKEGIISAIAERAIKKYTDKFKKAVLSGPLQGASTGILLCFLKSEQYVIPPLLMDYLHGAALPPPPELFSEKTIGLDMVWGHTLTSQRDKEYLQPEALIKWFRQ